MARYRRVGGSGRRFDTVAQMSRMHSGICRAYHRSWHLCISRNLFANTAFDHMHCVDHVLRRETRLARVRTNVRQPPPWKSNSTVTPFLAVRQAVGITMRISNHLGTSFGIWNGGHAWFWFVADAHRNGAVIGAAANEAEAIGEARSSIEEMAEQRSANAVSPGISKTTLRATRECSPASSTDLGGNDSPGNPECYLTRLCSQFV
jgi:hypothetical protein